MREIDRSAIEDAIEVLIEILDLADDDADLEPDEPEEQHDAEADLTWSSPPASAEKGVNADTLTGEDVLRILTK